MAESDLDVVGNWTEVKLQILRDYSKEYAKILNKQRIKKLLPLIETGLKKQQDSNMSRSRYP
jgi:hypothetical protein